VGQKPKNPAKTLAATAAVRSAVDSIGKFFKARGASEFANVRGPILDQLGVIRQNIDNLDQKGLAELKSAIQSLFYTEVPGLGKLYMAEWQKFKGFNQGADDTSPAGHTEERAAAFQTMSGLEALRIDVDCRLQRPHTYTPIEGTSVEGGAMSKVYSYRDDSGSLCRFKPLVEQERGADGKVRIQDSILTLSAEAKALDAEVARLTDEIEKSGGGTAEQQARLIKLKGEPGKWSEGECCKTKQALTKAKSRTPNSLAFNGTISGDYVRNMASDVVRQTFEGYGAPHVMVSCTPAKVGGSFGVMMENASGISPSARLDPDRGVKPSLPRVNETTGRREWLNADIARQGTWIQLLDCVCGQEDSHNGNIIYDTETGETGTLKRIDLDASFPLPEVRGSAANTLPTSALGAAQPTCRGFNSRSAAQGGERMAGDKAREIGGSFIRSLYLPPVVSISQKKAMRTMWKNASALRDKLAATGLPESAVNATMERLKILNDYVSGQSVSGQRVQIIDDKQWGDYANYVNACMEADEGKGELEESGGLKHLVELHSNELFEKLLGDYTDYVKASKNRGELEESGGLEHLAEPHSNELFEEVLAKRPADPGVGQVSDEEKASLREFARQEVGARYSYFQGVNPHNSLPVRNFCGFD
jgi:hypothetical protein